MLIRFDPEVPYMSLEQQIQEFVKVIQNIEGGEQILA
jgi:hypothetical protein